VVLFVTTATLSIALQPSALPMPSSVLCKVTTSDRNVNFYIRSWFDACHEQVRSSSCYDRMVHNSNLVESVFACISFPGPAKNQDVTEQAVRVFSSLL
jgi:hypothetical protein